MATIREVARQANVSIATASRALNNHANVSSTTRLLVLKTAQELGYPISQLKNAPQISRSVLVLTREQDGTFEQTGISSDPEFDRKVWIGVHNALEEHNIAARLQRSRMLLEEAYGYSNDVGISALILLGGVLNRDFVNNLVELDLPFVVVGSHLRPLEVNVVMADFMGGTCQAVEHLVNRSRRRIGMVNGPETTSTSKEKYLGLRLSLSMHDLPFQPSQIISGDFTPEDGYTATQKLFQQCPNLDAIIYADDRMAMGGIQALKEMGCLIPQDISITSFGNYEISRYIEPQLTSVHYDMNNMGIIAARRICNLLSEPDNQPLCIVVPTKLIVRKSS